MTSGPRDVSEIVDAIADEILDRRGAVTGTERWAATEGAHRALAGVPEPADCWAHSLAWDDQPEDVRLGLFRVQRRDGTNAARRYVAVVLVDVHSHHDCRSWVGDPEPEQ